MRVALLLSALWLLVGCAYGNEPTETATAPSFISDSETVASKVCTGAFVIRDGFSDAQLANVKSAILRFNAFIGAQVLREDSDSSASSASCSIEPGELPGDFVGYHANGVITIDLAKAPTDDVWFQHLAMHEIGHVLGLNHVTRGVMSETNLTATPDFTDQDRAECRRALVCSF